MEWVWLKREKNIHVYLLGNYSQLSQLFTIKNDIHIYFMGHLIIYDNDSRLDVCVCVCDSSKK